jgi:hypothetical protein
MSQPAANSSPKDGGASGGADEARDEVPFDLESSAPVTCKHYNARIIGSEPIGRITCPDCGNMPPMYRVINNWLDRLADVA